MLMRDVSLTQRIPCIIRISIFKLELSQWKKSAHYTQVDMVIIFALVAKTFRQALQNSLQLLSQKSSPSNLRILTYTETVFTVVEV